MKLVELDENNKVIGVFQHLPAGNYALTSEEVPVGAVYDRVGGSFSPPERKRWVTTRRFRERLSMDENRRSELLIMRGSRSGATELEEVVAADVMRLNRMLSDGPYVDLDDPTTRAGIQALSQIPGFFDHPTRADEILDGPIPEYQYHPDA